MRLQQSAKAKPRMVHADRVEPWIEQTDEPTPEWVAKAVKKYAPEKQEVGVQVSLDLIGGGGHSSSLCSRFEFFTFTN